MADLTQLIAMMRGSGRKPQQGFDPNYLNDESIDPSVRADAGLGALESERSERLDKELNLQASHPEMTSAPQIGALSALLGRVQSQRSKSPLVAQAAEVANQRTNDLTAINEGFNGSQPVGGQGAYGAVNPMSPMQQREIYKRGFTEQNSPNALQNARIADSQFQQGRQLNQANRTVMAQMTPAMIYAEIAKQAAARSANDQPGGMNDIKQIGKNGVTYQTRPNVTQVNPNNLINNLQREMGYVQGDPFEGFGTGRNPGVENAVRTYVVNSGLHPDDQSEIIDVLSTPEDAGLTIDQLTQKYGWNINDVDYPKFVSLLRQFGRR